MPQGCSHCTNQHLECFVTDRVTGRTERRGYVQELERKQNSMLNRIHDLERLLAHHGIEVMPFDPSLPSGTRDPPSTAEYALNENGDREGRKWIKLGSVWAKNTVNKARSRSALQPRPSDRGYLGVSSDQEPLSSIKGTTLSVLGTSIDIMQFDAADVDMDEPPPDAQVAENLYNKSVQAFLQSVMNINSVPDAHLPIRKDAFQYSEWYFLMVHPFLPVIHKPSYMNLVGVSCPSLPMLSHCF